MRRYKPRNGLLWSLLVLPLSSVVVSIPWKARRVKIPSWKKGRGIHNSVTSHCLQVSGSGFLKGQVQWRDYGHSQLKQQVAHTLQGWFFKNVNLITQNSASPTGLGPNSSTGRIRLPVILPIPPFVVSAPSGFTDLGAAHSFIPEHTSACPPSPRPASPWLSSWWHQLVLQELASMGAEPAPCSRLYVPWEYRYSVLVLSSHAENFWKGSIGAFKLGV